MKHVDLEKFANGAFSAQVNRAIEEVTENIQNPNTDAGAARKITVTIAFKPNAERNFVATGVQTKTTLAPALGAVTAFSMGKNLQTGEVEAVEMGNQIPGQMSINDVPVVVPELRQIIFRKILRYPFRLTEEKLRKRHFLLWIYCLARLQREK